VEDVGVGCCLPGAAVVCSVPGTCCLHCPVECIPVPARYSCPTIFRSVTLVPYHGDVLWPIRYVLYSYCCWFLDVDATLLTLLIFLPFVFWKFIVVMSHCPTFVPFRYCSRCSALIHHGPLEMVDDLITIVPERWLHFWLRFIVVNVGIVVLTIWYVVVITRYGDCSITGDCRLLRAIPPFAACCAIQHCHYVAPLVPFVHCNSGDSSSATITFIRFDYISYYRPWCCWWCWYLSWWWFVGRWRSPYHLLQSYCHSPLYYRDGAVVTRCFCYDVHDHTHRCCIVLLRGFHATFRSLWNYMPLMLPSLRCGTLVLRSGAIDVLDAHSVGDLRILFWLEVFGAHPFCYCWWRYVIYRCDDSPLRRGVVVFLLVRLPFICCKVPTSCRFRSDGTLSVADLPLLRCRRFHDCSAHFRTVVVPIFHLRAIDQLRTVTPAVSLLRVITAARDFTCPYRSYVRAELVFDAFRYGWFYVDFTLFGAFLFAVLLPVGICYCRWRYRCWNYLLPCCCYLEHFIHSDAVCSVLWFWVPVMPAVLVPHATVVAGRCLPAMPVMRLRSVHLWYYHHPYCRLRYGGRLSPFFTVLRWMPLILRTVIPRLEYFGLLLFGDSLWPDVVLFTTIWTYADLLLTVVGGYIWSLTFRYVTLITATVVLCDYRLPLLLTIGAGTLLICCDAIDAFVIRWWWYDWFDVTDWFAVVVIPSVIRCVPAHLFCCPVDAFVDGSIFVICDFIRLFVRWLFLLFGDSSFWLISYRWYDAILLEIPTFVLERTFFCCRWRPFYYALRWVFHFRVLVDLNCRMVLEAGDFITVHYRWRYCSVCCHYDYSICSGYTVHDVFRSAICSRWLMLIVVRCSTTFAVVTLYDLLPLILSLRLIVLYLFCWWFCCSAGIVVPDVPSSLLPFPIAIAGGWNAVDLCNFVIVLFWRCLHSLRTLWCCCYSVAFFRYGVVRFSPFYTVIVPLLPFLLPRAPFDTSFTFFVDAITVTCCWWFAHRNSEFCYYQILECDDTSLGDCLLPFCCIVMLNGDYWCRCSCSIHCSSFRYPTVVVLLIILGWCHCLFVDIVDILIVLLLFSTIRRRYILLLVNYSSCSPRYRDIVMSTADPLVWLLLGIVPAVFHWWLNIMTIPSYRSSSFGECICSVTLQFFGIRY